MRTTPSARRACSSRWSRAAGIRGGSTPSCWRRRIPSPHPCFAPSRRGRSPYRGEAAAGAGLDELGRRADADAERAAADAPGGDELTMPRSRRLALSALAVLAVAASALVSFRWCYDPDLWWHLAQGREIAAAACRGRTCSASRTRTSRNRRRLALRPRDLRALAHGGAAAVQLGQAAALVVTLALLFAACRQRAGIAASAAVVAFGFFVLSARVPVRTLSFAGMAALRC
jgi:hypothetical protein